VEIRDQKELATLIALLRKHGVKSLNTAGVMITMGDKPEPRAYKKAHKEPDTTLVTEQYSPEEILMWSSGGAEMPLPEGN